MALVKVNLLAIRDFLLAWKRLLWIGPLTVAGSLFLFFFYYFIWSVFLLDIMEKVLTSLPFQVSVFSVFVLGLIIPLAGSVKLLTTAWIRADCVLYTEDDSEWTMEFGRAIMVVAQMALFLSGILVILWVANYAIVPRVEGVLPSASLVVSGLIFVAFIPLWSRIWLLPATAAVEGDNTSGIWNSLCSVTRGYSIPVFLSVLVQLIPLVIIVGIISQMDLTALRDSFDSIQTVRPEILGIILKNTPMLLVLILIIPGGVYISLLAVQQTETVRYFMAAPSMSATEYEDEEDEDRNTQTLAEALSNDDRAEREKMTTDVPKAPEEASQAPLGESGKPIYSPPPSEPTIHPEAPPIIEKPQL